MRGLLLAKDSSKVTQLKDLALENKAVALVLTETWLTDSVSDAEIQIQNYVLYRSDRSERCKGGSAYMCTLVLLQS